MKIIVHLMKRLNNSPSVVAHGIQCANGRNMGTFENSGVVESSIYPQLLVAVVPGPSLFNLSKPPTSGNSKSSSIKQGLECERDISCRGL